MVIIFNDNNDINADNTNSDNNIYSNNIIPWDIIAKVAIYMENFKLETKFNTFNKQRDLRFEETLEFLKQNEFINCNTILKQALTQFYCGVSYGFLFEDLFISSDGKRKILVMQKVQLDDNTKRCPVCLSIKNRCNSYINVLHKSFECQNPKCATKSESNRGKRFDLLSAKRQTMLKRNDQRDYISNTLWKRYRRDIFDEYELSDLIKLYSWADDTVLLINFDSDNNNSSVNNNNNINNIFGRKIVHQSLKDITPTSNSYNKLPIVKLFNAISKNICLNQTIKNTDYQARTVNQSVFIHGNSLRLLRQQLTQKYGVIGAAITSPPYYNAREYSSWQNMLCYLSDMLIHAKAVYDVLKCDATCVYNIGDVVAQDNIYIKSTMSKRRQMLGFYSIMLFEIAGFNIQTNIVWDKGEVQSKRNASQHHVSGYLKPINCYEHCFVFHKGVCEPCLTQVRKIAPVKKINAKGENILGHTAPYPLEIAELILPYVNIDSNNNKDFVLDSFLGSGTTALAMKKYGIKTIGFELNRDYFELAVKRFLGE